MKVVLSVDEFSYLTNSLLKNNQEFLPMFKLKTINTNSVDIYLDEDIADEIRELAIEELVFHFDENYVPTVEGRILELFIDKFFTG